MVARQTSIDQTTLDALVHRIVYSHPETGFTILSVKSGPRNKRIMVLGDLSRIKPGQQIRFHGHYTVSEKHGKQFKALHWEEIRPETREGLIRYLAGQFEGIGPQLAKRIVDDLGPSTLDIIENEPRRLRSVPGIGRKKSRAIIQEWKNKRALAEVSLFLSNLKLGPLTAQKIIREYGFSTEAIIRENPFRLATEIRGMGFASADEIAARLDIRGDDPRRLNAAVKYELTKARDEGHVCLPRNELVKRCVILLEQPGKTINGAIDAAQQAGEVVFRPVAGGADDSSRVMVFEKSLDWVEENLSRNIKRLYRARITRLNADIDIVYRKALQITGLKPDPVQRDALDLLKSTPIFVITGGPGTGKTTLVNIILEALHGLTVKMAAPTGRAAQRLTETTGREAATLHRLLEFVPQSASFNRNASRPLGADCVIVDESSMIDTPLAAALMRALKKGTRLILVGDVDQLPSVGPGRILGDLIDSGLVPVVRLNRIYRQAGGSQIVMNAHRIINGKIPVAPEKTSDYVFIEKDEPEEALDVIRRLPHRIARHLGAHAVDDVQVLSPMHRGLLGVQNLNEVLREELNPQGAVVPGPSGYRHGDKVMQIRNNYDLEVFNGDVGRVQGADGDNRIRIAFSSRTIPYSVEMLDQIVPAFACSIHKSQGSEYPAVIVPVHTQHYIMLRRQLLYTAVTRGKKMVVIVGSRKAMGIAVKNSHEDARHTLLKQRLQ